MKEYYEANKNKIKEYYEANKNKIPIILETPIDERRTDFENIRKAKDLA